MIARNEVGPEICKQIDNIIGYLNQTEVNYQNPYEYPIWADEIALRDEYKFVSGWHFFNQPFCDGIDPTKINLIVDPRFNAVFTVLESIKVLNYKPPYPFNFDGEFEKSYMMRFLIHLAGDMYQPLHVVTRCTPAMPSCDQGGNLFPIQAGNFTRNLHALWDQAMQKILFETRVIFLFLTQKAI